MSFVKVNSFSRKLTYSLQRLLFRNFMIATSEQFGLKFKFKSEDVVGRHIYKYDIHELEITKALLSEITIEEGDIVLDVGANLGWYALVFAKKGATVHAFEPDPLNNDLLKENISINKLSQSITSHLYAISDKQAIVPLYLYPHRNRGRHSLNPNIGCKKIDVQTTTLNTFLDESKIDVKRIKLLKIDIEGHELPALQGASKILEHVPNLLIEHGPEHIRKGGFEPNDIIDLLHHYHFKPYTVTKEGIREATIQELYGDDNEQNIFWRKQAITK